MQAKKQKISFIATVYNEEEKIKKFIDSILNQSIKPDEIIIVDAGSSDRTVSYIKKYKNIILRIKKCNRSVGRNEAIKHAKGDIIVASDAGCILDKNWLKNIVKRFNSKKADVVAGYYKPTGISVFQKCVSTYTSVMPDKLDEKNFLPSSRSIGFKKYAWKKVGGYPENLDTCEDLVFAMKLKDAKFRFKTAKDAIVYWEQVDSFKSAFVQFFNYAKGDGKARYFRTQTPYLFLRYIFFIYLVLLNFIIKTYALKFATLAILVLYIVWAINKNYKYIKTYKALFYLPCLQFLSDTAVISGTSIGFLWSLSINEIKEKILRNRFILFICLVYILLMLYVIKWGIPGTSHPFNYHMDEWHFLQSVSAFFKHGTTTISGSANIPVYHVLSSSIFLIPFYLLKVINPLAITSALENLSIQQKLFEILRLHTLFYGVLVIVFIYKILNKYIRSFPKIFTALFIFTPIWISLSNYYKYDIVLTFWIVLTVYFIFKFYKTKEINNYIFAGISTGLAMSTKFTAAPLLITYLLSFFIFSKKIKIKYFFQGIILPIFIFIFFGIPDLVFGKGNYQELLFSTLIKGPKYSADFNIKLDPWLFLTFKEFPSIFGYFLFYVFLFGFFYLILFSLIKIFKGKYKECKEEIFLLVSFIIFTVPLFSFGIEGGGNRALVLLPFMILILSLFTRNILLRKSLIIKNFVLLILIIGFLVNLLQSYSWYVVKFHDPRELSSLWIINNIPKNSEIGIENIPIYQMLPDVVLKEYYLNNNYNTKVNFEYKIVDKQTKKLPEYIIITNDFDDLSYVDKSEKKELVARLNKERYKKIKIFNANLKYFNLNSDKLLLNITNIIPVPVVISIHKNIK